MNYISSQRHDGTVSCIKKIVYRQNTGGTTDDKNGYIALVKRCMCARLAMSVVVCGYWLSEARVFLCKTKRKCRNTCYLRDTLFRDTPCVTPEYGKRGRPRRLVRRVYIFGQNKIDRAREEHALTRPMDLILISVLLFSKGFGKCAKRELIASIFVKK